MFVTVIHRIPDPEGFQAAEAKALEAGLPATSHTDPRRHQGSQIRRLHLGRRIGRCRSRGGRRCRRPMGDNEYFEMHVDGLTPQLTR